MYIRSLTISSISHYTFFFLYYPKAHTTGHLENSLYIFVFLFNFLFILNFFISFFTLFYKNSFLLHMHIKIFSCIIYFFFHAVFMCLIQSIYYVVSLYFVSSFSFPSSQREIWNYKMVFCLCT